MKILYTGHYKEGTGWGIAAQNTIMALHSIGMDVVCRNIPLTEGQRDTPSVILELENKSLDNIDICIQHVLPHHLVGTNKFKKNIAYVVFESSCLTFNSWLDQLKYMDEVWVPCQQNKNDLEEAGIKKVCVIPYAFDLEKYGKQNADSLNFKNHSIESSYKFYTMADFNKRKNLESVIKTYYSTFYSHENVTLILKINKKGHDSQALFRAVHDLCAGIRQDLAIYNNDSDYNNIMVISEYFSESEMLNLHKACDCFINMSHGEGWSIPSFEAMCYGNHPICANWGGPTEYIDNTNKNTGTLIDYSNAICSNAGAAFSHIFTGKEFWINPDEKQASDAMRYYFENRDDSKSLDGMKQGEKFSYTNVGKTIKETLENAE